MKGLLIKDLINIKGQWLVFTFIIAVWIIVGIVNGQASFFIGVMQMLVVMIPLTVAAYDEKAGWEKFALTMPVTRRQIVFSRYLLVGIVLIPLGLLSFTGSLFICGNWEESMVVTLFAIPFGLIINCLMLPILFRFGVERGRLLFLGAVALFVLSGFLVGKLPMNQWFAGVAALPLDFSNVWNVLLLFWIGVLLCIAASLAGSIRIYQRREF